MDNLVGQTLNRYKITALIGEGGMGAVFKATDMALERDVAIKIMHPNFARQQDFQSRFLQEARTAARMNHPGIVQVYDFGQDRGRLYIVMKYIPGDNLDEILTDLRSAKRWIPLAEAIGLIRQTALALEYAHRQGVLHRDLKPGNIMIEPEPSDGLPYRPVITDLGLAKLAGGGGVVTQDHMSMGTPAYMSPEQAQGKPTDARSDVYSLGVLLFELVTGRLPFYARSLGEAIRFHVQTPPPKPRSLRPDLPESVENVILRALEKESSRRFQSASAFADALYGLSGDANVIIAPPPGVDQSLSLLTQYQNSLVKPRGVSIFEDFQDETVAQASDDRVLILAGDGSKREAPLKRTGMTIGRDPENDIPIDDAKASRRHARIDFDGQSYRVTDLNSTNGVYMGGERLIPGIPRAWGSETAVRIGDTHLRLARHGQALPGTVASSTVASPAAPRRPSADDQPAPPEPTRRARPAEAPGVQAFTSDLRPSRLRSGQVGRLTIRNLGNSSDTYSLSWDLATDDIEFTPPYLNVNAAPGQEVVIEFRADPRRSNLFGGERRYGFNAQVRPSAGPAQVHPGEVTVPSALPGWAVPVLIILCLGLAGLSALLVSSMFGSPAVSPTPFSAAALTETAAPALTSLAQSVEATRTAESLMATSLANANQATLAAATATGAANATQFSATQTGLAVGAQTAVAQTAQAQQATFQVGFTQTAIASQVTHAAAVTLTTGASVFLTQQAGAVQTVAALTAAANQSAALTATALAQAQSQALTATAQAFTATAQADIITQTAQAQRRVALIHAGDTGKANDYKSFLQSQEYVVDLIPVEDVNAVDFSPYQVIIIGADTGHTDGWEENAWGDPDEVQANLIAAANKPVLGLGNGGSLFFQALGLNIAWGNKVVATGVSVRAVDASAPLWTTPYNVGVPSDSIVELYDGNSDYISVMLPDHIDEVLTIGQQVDEPTQYPIVSEDGRFLLWGFNDGPADMTNRGQRLFINILRALAP